MTPGSIIAALAASTGLVLIVAGVCVLMIFIEVFVFLSRYARVGPNQVLIVSGRSHKYRAADGSEQARNFRIVKGGGTFVYPVLEKAYVLPLEVLTSNVRAQGAHTSDGMAIDVDAVAQLKIKGDDDALAAAAEHFLNKPADEIRNFAAQIIEARLRDTLRSMSFAEISGNRDLIASRVQRAASDELAGTGLTVLSFAIPEARGGQSQPQANQQPGEWQSNRV